MFVNLNYIGFSINELSYNRNVPTYQFIKQMRNYVSLYIKTQSFEKKTKGISLFTVNIVDREYNIVFHPSRKVIYFMKKEINREFHNLEKAIKILKVVILFFDIINIWEKGNKLHKFEENVKYSIFHNLILVWNLIRVKLQCHLLLQEQKYLHWTVLVNPCCVTPYAAVRLKYKKEH